MASEKPLSPHIQIYRWEITMLVSILHRAAGIAMAVGTGLVVWMLLALATGPQAYDCFHQFITSPLGSLLLLGWTVAIFLHMGNGIRHFFWDVGKGYSIPVAHRSAYLLIAFTTIMTLIVWFVGCPWQ
jgi:succinate dehydrogenase / fumarate reductase cytochrome b subunit